MKDKTIIFCGIRFYNASFLETFHKLNAGKKGYLVAPAASSLAKIKSDIQHHNALKKAKLAILDSGLFCVLLFFFKGIRVKKYSGFLFLHDLIKTGYLINNKVLLIDPSINDSKKNLSYLFSKNIKNTKSYLAPIYNKKLKIIKDIKLIRQINKFQPRYILINIGGEIQERLALYIQHNVKYKITTFCLGAAIGFFTGSQARVNVTIDKFYLGWLFRLIHNPKVFFIRLIYSLKILNLFFSRPMLLK